jgi:DNA-binding ferritin-like protein
MSHRRESKQQRRANTMEKRRKMDQVASQMIQERIERRLSIIEDIKQKIAMIEEQESAPTVDATEEEVPVSEVEVV